MINNHLKIFCINQFLDVFIRSNVVPIHKNHWEGFILKIKLFPFGYVFDDINQCKLHFFSHKNNLDAVCVCSIFRTIRQRGSVHHDASSNSLFLCLDGFINEISPPAVLYFECTCVSLMELIQYKGNVVL